MGYSFTIKAEHALKVKKDGHYPWPCQREKDRTIELFTDDVLTKNADDGKYVIHTGLGCFGIVLADDEVEPWGRDVALRLG